MEGRQVELGVLVKAAHALAARADALLVEGAGGLLSPWGPGLHLATFAAALRLPILIVAPNRLGTISQTALVAAECRRRELLCLGFVLVHVSPTVTPDQDTNAEEIVREANLPFFGALPHIDPTDDDALADGAAMTLNVTSIIASASGAATVSR
jgi:dethiobiotin synthetase